jgi:hypothetical protein
VAGAVALAPLSANAATLLQDTFSSPNGLITNEYAHWNPGSSSAKKSTYWDMTSGSLFAKDGRGWTGKIDDCEPNATSSNCTNSAIFRLNTKNFSYGNVKVSFKLYQNGLTSTRSTPAVDWDGVHIFLRYKSEQSLYYASVNRRDGHVVIKKKCSGGSSNGGTYYTLAERSGYAIPYGTWQNVAASAQNVSGGVTLKLYRAGTQLLSVTDTGKGCAAITSNGATGVRGDNDQFLFDDFTVVSL